MSDPNYEPPKTNPDIGQPVGTVEKSCGASLILIFGALTPSILVMLFGTDLFFEGGTLTEKLVYAIGVVALVLAIGMGVFQASYSTREKRNYEGYVILWLTIHTILYCIALGIAFVAGCQFLVK